MIFLKTVTGVAVNTRIKELWKKQIRMILRCFDSVE